MPTDESSSELEQLRAQVSGLKAQLSDAQAQVREAKAQAAEAHRAGSAQAAAAGGRRGQPGQAAPPRKRNWRSPIAVVLVVLGCLVAPAALVTVWASTQVSSTPRYVANVQPLISEPAVQSALTARISTEIIKQIDVPKLEAQAARELKANGMTTLGDLITNFSGPIQSGIGSAVNSAVSTVITSQAAAKIWTQANTIAHTALVQALEGNPNAAITIANGQVVLQLGPMIDQVKANLAARGFTVVNGLPTINPTFPLFSAKYLLQARSLYSALTTLAWVLPLLSLLLLAGGIYLARGHRRTLVGSGVGLVISMAVLGIGLWISRGIYLNSVPPTLPADAAAAVYDTLIRFIWQDLWVLIVVGLAVAIGGFFMGPSVSATRTRGACVSGFARARAAGERAGVRLAGFGDWVFRDRRLLRVVAVVAAVVVLVIWSYPTPLVALTIALILLVVNGLIELLGRRPAEAGAAASGRPAGQPVLAGAGRPGDGPSRDGHSQRG